MTALVEVPPLVLTEVPRRIAIMLDGNRRWARERGLQPWEGHWQGAAALVPIVRAAAEMGVQVLTVWGLSTENWGRPQNEVDAILRYIGLYLDWQRAPMVRDGVRFGTIGDLSKLSSGLQKKLEKTKLATAGGSRIELVLALNYGGRDDLRRAITRLAQECVEGRLSPSQISEEMIASHVDTAPWGDPDLLIRPGGSLRLSNFLLWQCSYTEVVVTDTLWPDFTPDHLKDAISEFQNRKRRFGR